MGARRSNRWTKHVTLEHEARGSEGRTQWVAAAEAHRRGPDGLSRAKGGKGAAHLGLSTNSLDQHSVALRVYYGIRHLVRANMA